MDGASCDAAPRARAFGNDERRITFQRLGLRFSTLELLKGPSVEKLASIAMVRAPRDGAELTL